MTASPWLTVVTVVKDDAAGFERTLASMSRQDLAGVEYLVVDSSGDRDAIPGLLAASGVPGSVTWTEPAGIYTAMNTGLASAAGAYVYFLNAGDELAGDDVIARLRDAIDREAPTWCYGDVEILGADGSRVVTPPWDYEAEKASAFSRGHFPAHQGTIVRTDVLRSVGCFDRSFSIVADYAAFLRLTQVSGPLRLDLVLARFHEGGVSTTRWAASLRQFHRARREILRPAGVVARRERLASARQFAAMAAYRSPWPLVAALLVFGVGFMGFTGVSWANAGLLILFVAFQALGGALWWRMLRPTRPVSILEAVGMGLGLGTASAMLTGLFWAWWLAPLVTLAAWLIRTRWRGRPVAPLAPLARIDLAALVVGLVPGVAAIWTALRAYPLAWNGLWTGYHGDMAFFEALAASVARLGPGASIFMSGAELRYHSLAYGWAGQLTLTASAEPFVVLTRLLPLVTLIAVVALAGSWARRMSTAAWVPALAVGLVVTGGFVGATYGSVLNFDSPSQSMGAVWLLALSPLLIQSLTRVNLPWHLLGIAVLMTALAGGKISTAAVAAGGIGLVALVALARREPWRWRALAVGGVSMAALAVTYALLLAGSANSGGLGLFTLLNRASSVQGLNPVVTPKGIVAGIAILTLAIMPRWAGLAWLIGARPSRWAPTTVYGLGLALGGIATVVLLSGGFNDLWFAVAASAPLAVLSAVGTGTAVQWLGQRRLALAAAAWGLVISLVVVVMWASGSTGMLGAGWRWAGPIGGITLAIVGAFALSRRARLPRTASVFALAVTALVVAAVPARIVYAVAEPFARPHEGSLSTVLFTPNEPFLPTRDQSTFPGWSDTQALAAAWLRSHAQPADLVATNLTLSAIVPALTHRTTYVSDIHMQAPYGMVAELPRIQQREADSWAFIDEPTATTVDPMCAAGVDWVWVDPSRTESRSWAPYATVAYATDDALILRMEPSGCS